MSDAVTVTRIHPPTQPPSYGPPCDYKPGDLLRVKDDVKEPGKDFSFFAGNTVIFSHMEDGHVEVLMTPLARITMPFHLHEVRRQLPEEPISNPYGRLGWQDYPANDPFCN